jgi:hypothetical protein
MLAATWHPSLTSPRESLQSRADASLTGFFTVAVDKARCIGVVGCCRGILQRTENPISSVTPFQGVVASGTKDVSFHFDSSRSRDLDLRLPTFALVRILTTRASARPPRVMRTPRYSMIRIALPIYRTTVKLFKLSYKYITLTECHGRDNKHLLQSC